jgi:purine-binding chemotaxis protein CheW
VPRKKAETQEAAAPAPQADAPALDDLTLSQFEIAPELEEEEAEASRAMAQAVTFTLGDQLYALPIEVVQEIQQIVELLPLPDSTPWLVGLIDMRGTVVPAIDLRSLVGLPAAEYALETPMVFCHAGAHLVALIVDGVEDVVDLPEGCIQPPSALYSLADRMIGVARLGSGLVPILDIERLVPQLAFAIADQAGGGL